MTNCAVHIYIYIYNIDICYVLQLAGCSSSILVALDSPGGREGASAMLYYFRAAAAAAATAAEYSVFHLHTRTFCVGRHGFL